MEEVVEAKVVVFVIIGGREAFAGPKPVEPVRTGLAGSDRAEHYCFDTWREMSGV